MAMLKSSKWLSRSSVYLNGGLSQNFIPFISLTETKFRSRLAEIVQLQLSIVSVIYIEAVLCHFKGGGVGGGGK